MQTRTLCLTKNAVIVIHNNVQINRLNYYSLLSSIPNKWKRIIGFIAADTPTDQTKFLSKIKELRSMAKVCKPVYLKLIDFVLEKPTNCLIKWNFCMNKNFTTEYWLTSFRQIYKTTSCTKMQNFQFRLMHRTLVTNEMLYKWGINESDLCCFCNEEIETIEHIFVECEVIKIFWERVIKWIQNKMGIILQLKVEEKLFGNNILPIIDLVILIARKCIYFCRCNNQFPQIKGFESRIWDMYYTEKYIAVKNDKLTLFNNKWVMLTNFK